jgi:hypothetical protein
VEPCIGQGASLFLFRHEQCSAARQVVFRYAVRDEKAAADCEEPVNLSVQLRHVAFVTDLVHRLHRHDRVVWHRQALHPACGSEIGVYELGGRISGDAASTHFEHRLGKIQQGVFGNRGAMQEHLLGKQPGA